MMNKGRVTGFGTAVCWMLFAVEAFAGDDTSPLVQRAVPGDQEGSIRSKTGWTQQRVPFRPDVVIPMSLRAGRATFVQGVKFSRGKKGHMTAHMIAELDLEHHPPGHYRGAIYLAAFDKEGLLVAAGHAEIDSMSASIELAGVSAHLPARDDASIEFADVSARFSARDDDGPFLEFRLDGFSAGKQKHKCKLDCGDVGPMEEIDHVVISAWTKPDC
ncbi:MAG: hypothetical protein ACYTG0_42260 [Planctomycetota bacterium]|jgi:hypothetical protein